MIGVTMTTARPTTATILFSDLVNSTELLQRVGDETAQRVFETHHRLLRDAVAAHGGAEVKWTGDGLMVAFNSATAAVRGAIAMQQAARRPAAGEQLQIRVGLQVGEALRHDATDYFGTTVVIASRLCALAKAGEILCTATVRALISDASAFDFRDRGELALKGIAAPVATLEVQYEHDPLAMLTVTPFVGRGDVIASLTARLEEARGGRGSLAMLVGEPGIGKTRTAEEFAALTRHKGATVLSGRCYDGEWAPPFSPFVEAIKEYAAATSPDRLAAALGADAGVLARIVPALHELLPDIAEPPAIPAEGERYRLLDAASNLFTKIASSGPLVLLLDDLHWADKGTIAMLRQIARQAPAQALVIVGGYRDVELDRTHPLAAALADLRRETPFERIVLKGLAAEEVGALLDVIAEQDVPRSLVDAIAGETNGNPFFIKEVLLHLVEERKIVQEDGRWTSTLTIADMGIPEGVREVIGRRLSRLSASCNAMLTASSAMTGGFSWVELQAICEAPERALLDALDEALVAQVLVETASGTYDFTHALIRHTLYEELSTPRRVLLHRQIGEALERLYAGDLEPHLAELAHHFYEASPGGDVPKAVEYARRAGDRAASQFAFEEAVGQYERAIEQLGRAPSNDRALEAECALGRAYALYRSGRDDESVASYAQAGELARAAGRADLLVRAATRDDNLFGTRGEPFTTLLRDALQLLPTGDSRERVAVMAQLGSTWDFASGGNLDMGLVDDSIHMSRRLQDSSILAFALHYKCWGMLFQREIDELLHVTEEYESLGPNGASASYWRLIVLYRLGRIDDAHRELDRYLERAQESRIRQFRALGCFLQAMREQMRGNFATSHELAMQGMTVGRGWSGFDGWLIANAATRAWEEGREPWSELDPIVSAARSDVWTRIVSAYALPVGADAEAVRALVDRLPIDSYAKIPPTADWLPHICGAAEAVSFIDDRDRCQVLYELLAPHAHLPVFIGAHNSAALGSCARFVGRLAFVVDRLEDAARSFEQALVDNTRWGMRPSVARTQMDYARMLRKRGADGDAARARTLLEAALATAREIGMAKVAADCELLLAEA